MIEIMAKIIPTLQNTLLISRISHICKAIEEHYLSSSVASHVMIAVFISLLTDYLHREWKTERATLGTIIFIYGMTTIMTFEHPSSSYRYIIEQIGIVSANLFLIVEEGITGVPVLDWVLFSLWVLFLVTAVTRLCTQLFYQAHELNGLPCQIKHIYRFCLARREQHLRYSATSHAIIALVISTLSSLLQMNSLFPTHSTGMVSLVISFVIYSMALMMQSQNVTSSYHYNILGLISLYLGSLGSILLVTVLVPSFRVELFASWAYYNIRRGTISFYRARCEQLLGSSSASHAIIALVISTLSSILQMNSLFQTHSKCMVSFVISFIIYAMALMMQSQHSRSSNHYSVLGQISLFSGSLASILLLTLLFPVLGWALFSLWAILFVTNMHSELFYQEFLKALYFLMRLISRFRKTSTREQPLLSLGYFHAIIYNIILFVFIVALSNHVPPITSLLPTQETIRMVYYVISHIYILLSAFIVFMPVKLLKFYFCFISILGKIILFLGSLVLLLLFTILVPIPVPGWALLSSWAILLVAALWTELFYQALLNGLLFLIKHISRFRQTRGAQHFGSSEASHAIIALVISTLSGLLQMISLFHTHKTCMVSFVISFFIYTTTLMMMMQSQHSTFSYLYNILGRISLFSGALASILLVIVLVPALGWVLFSLWAILFVIAVSSLYTELFYNDDREKREHLGSSEVSHAIIGLVISTLSSLLQMNSLFHTHKIGMVSFVISFFIYTLALMMMQSQHSDHYNILGQIILFSGSQHSTSDHGNILGQISWFSGSLASISLVIALVPVLGWVLFTLWASLFVKEFFYKALLNILLLLANHTFGFPQQPQRPAV